MSYNQVFRDISWTWFSSLGTCRAILNYKREHLEGSFNKANTDRSCHKVCRFKGPGVGLPGVALGLRA